MNHKLGRDRSWILQPALPVVKQVIICLSLLLITVLFSCYQCSFPLQISEFPQLHLYCLSVTQILLQELSSHILQLENKCVSVANVPLHSILHQNITSPMFPCFYHMHVNLLSISRNSAVVFHPYILRLLQIFKLKFVLWPFTISRLTRKTLFGHSLLHHRFLFCDTHHSVVLLPTSAS